MDPFFCLNNNNICCTCMNDVMNPIQSNQKKNERTTSGCYHFTYTQTHIESMYDLLITITLMMIIINLIRQDGYRENEKKKMIIWRKITWLCQMIFFLIINRAKKKMVMIMTIMKIMIFLEISHFSEEQKSNTVFFSFQKKNLLSFFSIFNQWSSFFLVFYCFNI